MPPRPPRPLRFTALLLGLPAAVALASPTLGAQVVESPLAPAGRLRLEVAPSFLHWQERFGLRVEDGVTVEEVEPLGFDLTDDRGVRIFPGLARLEAELRTALDDPTYQAVLGTSRAAVARDVTRIPLRAALGVFDWLTVGVSVPVVKARTEVEWALQTDTAVLNLGLSPTVSRASDLALFLETLGSRAAAAVERAEALCSVGAPGCAAAEALAQRVSSFSEGLGDAYVAAPFFPHEGSAAGGALQARMAALNDALAAAGLEPVADPLPLAAAPLDEEGLATAFNDIRGGFDAPPPGRVPGRWVVGDVEVSAAVRLLHGARRDSAGGPTRARWEVGAVALVRLGTGLPDDPDVFLDVGAGDGQTDFEVGLFGDWRGRSLGVLADLRYGVQLSTERFRRVVPPDVVLAPLATRLPVTWTPGDYLAVRVAPRWHFTPELGLAASWRFFDKGQDSFALFGEVSDPSLIPDPSLLELETAVTLHEVGVGLVYSAQASFPFQVRGGFHVAVAGSGGQTPKGVALELLGRLYVPIWDR